VCPEVVADATLGADPDPDVTPARGGAVLVDCITLISNVMQRCCKVLVARSGEKAVCLAVDLHKHLVDVPPRTARPHASATALSYLGSKHRPEPMPPEPDCFVADVDAALVEQVLDVSEAEWKPDVQHHGRPDDF
jgi:hypothetical protein